MASLIIQDGNGDTVIRLVLPELTVEAIFVVNLIELLNHPGLRRLNVQSLRQRVVVQYVVVGEAGNPALTLPRKIVAHKHNLLFGDVMMFAHMFVLNCATIMRYFPYFGKLVF